MTHFQNVRPERVESISVSEQLRTFPSPNTTLTLTCFQLIFVELRES